MSRSNRPVELDLLEGELTDEEISSIQNDVKNNSNESGDNSTGNVDILGIIKTLHNFAKQEDKSGAVTEVVYFISEKSGIPFGVPVPLGYGFSLIIASVNDYKEILYKKDIQNESMIEALHWLTYKGAIFKASVIFGTLSVMDCYLTINGNALQIIRRLPEALAFADSAANTVTKITSKTNVSLIAVKLLFKLIRKDCSVLDEMSCFYSEVPKLIQKKMKRKESKGSDGLYEINAFFDNTDYSDTASTADLEQNVVKAEQSVEKQDTLEPIVKEKEEFVLEVGEDLDDEDD